MATIQGVYVALFGRPADPLGLQFFNGVTNNGANLSAISALSSTKEYTDRFAGQNNNTIINSIYQSLFNRDAEPAGLAFFVDALNKGTLNINNIAIAILDGAQGNDKAILDSKLASADLFTKAIDTPAEVGAYIGNAAAAAGRAFLAGITTTTPATAAQADTAVAGIVSSGAAGNTVTLTAGADAVSLTGATGLKTSDLNDTINGTTAGLWAANDSINGGFGTDTLNATIGADVVVAVDGLKSVEIANITSTGGWKVDVANAKDTTQVWNVASAANVLTVENVALTTTVGMKDSISGNAIFKFAGATGTADAATLALNAAVGSGTAVIDDIETLTVSTTGTSTLTAINGTTLKTVTVTGSGTLTSNFATTVETISNTGTGNVTTDLTALNAIKTFTGGTGKDSVTLDGVHTNDVTINVGAGNDTVTLTAGDSTKAVTITLGAGNDQLTTGAPLGNVAAATDNNTKLLATLITVADFNKAEDAIKFDAWTAGAAGKEVLSVVEEANIVAATDLYGALQVVVATTANANYAVFAYKGDTYIFDNGNVAGLGTEDTLIKLTGVAVADLSVNNFEVV
jgi:hypothetical protein